MRTRTGYLDQAICPGLKLRIGPARGLDFMGATRAGVPWTKSRRPRSTGLRQLAVVSWKGAIRVPVRWTQETYCDGADKWERCLRGEEAAGFDFGEAFFQGEK
ncbi:MAG: hypothetical protein ABSF46_26950, partial [Terriglobia bacterium]